MFKLCEIHFLEKLKNKDGNGSASIYFFFFNDKNTQKVFLELERACVPARKAVSVWLSGAAPAGC